MIIHDLNQTHSVHWGITSSKTLSPLSCQPPPPLVKFANFRKFYKLFFVRFYFVFLSKNCTPPPPEKSYPLFPSNPPITPPPPPPPTEKGKCTL